MTAKRASSLVLAALLAVSIAACGGDDDKKDSGSGATTTIGVADGLRPFPTDTVKIPTKDDAPDDGEIAAYVTHVDVKKRTISVDYILFLTGDAANKAYQEETGSKEPVPNDYYIKNIVVRVNTLKVDKDVKVTLVDTSGSASNKASTFEKVADKAGPNTNPFWLTIKDGKVVEINEQYVP